VQGDDASQATSGKESHDHDKVGEDPGPLHAGEVTVNSNSDADAHSDSVSSQTRVRYSLYGL
jgi:hypothetical protein